MLTSGEGGGSGFNASRAVELKEHRIHTPSCIQAGYWGEGGEEGKEGGCLGTGETFFFSFFSTRIHFYLSP
jgi:hypothetical protein